MALSREFAIAAATAVGLLIGATQGWAGEKGPGGYNFESQLGLSAANGVVTMSESEMDSLRGGSFTFFANLATIFDPGSTLAVTTDSTSENIINASPEDFSPTTLLTSDDPISYSFSDSTTSITTSTELGSTTLILSNPSFSTFTTDSSSFTSSFSINNILSF